MSRNLKILVWGTATLILLGMIVWFSYLFLLRKAFGTKCQPKMSWTIENYKIIEESCIGWAGPPWYPMELYQDGDFIDRINFREDSCLVSFVDTNQDTLMFDLCDKKILKK